MVKTILFNKIVRSSVSSIGTEILFSPSTNKAVKERMSREKSRSLTKHLNFIAKEATFPKELQAEFVNHRFIHKLLF